MAIGDTYRLRCVWKHTTISTAAVNDFYFRQETATIFDTPEEDLWEAFLADLIPNYRALITNQLALVQVTVAKAPNFDTSLQIDNTGEVGGITGDALPGILGGVITRYTAELTRRGRGRIYLPPASESNNQSNGLPATTYVDAMQTFADLMLPTIGDGILTAEYTPMLWSESDQQAKPIVRWLARGYWGIQRDRRSLLLG